ncbi:coiled-coil domain-containing protein 157-like [Gigantopelta aegis]|uniref:coiled-coil domain-containing protein 157-like n=1 Tax=Gigantopelta aegis TaxID=1735272 RepID=UPI001B889739|nr:coiled-coil domain-containing protein 157-like [Gigantopelta aegis]
MAYMLGSETCMESLQNDIKDLQWAITDVCSHTGPLQCPSWKFPDKTSDQLDIEELLEMYSFSQDEEECQVAHIALYDLVIDRMVFLIHAFAKYTEQLLTPKVGRDNSVMTNSSVGLVVKKYWNRLNELHTTFQQEKSENRSKTRKIADLEKMVEKLSEEVKQYRNHAPVMKPSLMGVIPLNDADLARLNAGCLTVSDADISRDEYNKSSQTYETAFLPCESCGVVQKGLREAGKTIIEVCQSQSLPTSLKRFYVQTADLTWLSYNDVRRWVAEQNKDILRIHKHLEQTVATIKPLEAEVESCEKQIKQLEKKFSKCEKDLLQERETQSAVRKQFDMKSKEQEKKFTEDLALVTREKSQLEVTRKDLERSVEGLKEELVSQHETLRELETTNKELKVELEEKSTTVLEIDKLRSHVNNLESKLKTVTDTLKQSSIDLTREQAKNRSVSKHEQSLQSKQESLISRIDKLDEENTELRDQLLGLEDEKEAVEESLKSTQSQITELQKTIKENETVIKDLTRQKDEIQKDLQETRELIQKLEVKLEEAKERERLIIEYPDLNGPVNPDYQGSGDIVLDMEKQVEANTLRIRLLEEQNEGLRNSITKVLTVKTSKTTEPVKYQMTQPTPLWKTSTLEQYHVDDRDNHQGSLYQDIRGLNCNNSNSSNSVPNKAREQPSPVTKEQTYTSSASHVNINDTFLVGKATRPTSAVSAKTGSTKGRPLSANKVMVPVNATSIGAYLQMKKSGHSPQGNHNKTVKGSNKPPSGKPRQYAWADGDGFSHPAPTLACAFCDKMYSNSRDLEIHKSYCTG